jgi:hypothetical protein
MRCIENASTSVTNYTCGIPILYSTYAIVIEKILMFIQNQLSITFINLSGGHEDFHVMVHNVQPKIDSRNPRTNTLNCPS